MALNCTITKASENTRPVSGSMPEAIAESSASAALALDRRREVGEEVALEPGHEHAEGDRGRGVGERRADHAASPGRVERRTRARSLVMSAPPRRPLQNADSAHGPVTTSWRRFSSAPPATASPPPPPPPPREPLERYDELELRLLLPLLPLLL